MNNSEVQKEYRFYMERNFNESIFEYDKVKDILFNENQELHDLDKDIYHKILEIAKDYKRFQESVGLSERNASVSKKLTTFF